jgi:hypothetical protein
VANPNFFIVLSFSRPFEPWREARGSDVLVPPGDLSPRSDACNRPGQGFNSDGSN